MCFSPEVSLGASLVLATIGGMTLCQLPRISWLPLSLIPLFFSIQQLSEGILWIYLQHSLPPDNLSHFATLCFIFFAYIFWPIWIPFSLWLIEKVFIKKMIIGALLALSLIFILFCLAENWELPVPPRIIYHHLQYHSPELWKQLTYLSFILLSCFLSTVKGVRLFGILILISFIISKYFYTDVFVSFWCFFSAIISLYFFKIINDSRKKKARKDKPRR